MKTKNFYILTATLFCVLFSACTRVPLTGRSQLNMISDQTILSMSYQQHDQFMQKNKLSTNTEETQRVKRVGQRIQKGVERYFSDNSMSGELQDYKWEYNLIESDQVNAFCMPGGKVVVYTGLLQVAKDENGLAVVMGHEIAHAVAKHGNERMSQGLIVQMGGLALDVAMANQPGQARQLWMMTYGLGAEVGYMLPFSRLHEREADYLGLIFMSLAGYDPNGAIDFWKRMASKKGDKSPPELLSTHPSDQTRIDSIKEMIPEAMTYYRKSR